MKQFATIIAAVVALTLSTFAGDLVNVSGASNIALNGYDPVAFFTADKAAHGDPGISAKHQGATYIFSSKDNQRLFVSNPEKYAPQHGGFCSYGVSVGALFPVDISTWQVHDEKLYLNLNPAILELFNDDFKQNISKADTNWAKLKGEHAKK